MPISREPMRCAAPQQRLAARDVGARIGDELPGRDGAAQVDRRRRGVSISSVCSIITTASAPRGIDAAGRDRGGGAGRDVERGRDDRRRSPRR